MPKKKSSQRSQSIVFDSPRYTQIPDKLFDELLPDLSEAELKVLLYIMRRTFGWKKDHDTISISQMMAGIVKRNGEVLDRGTGLSKRSVTSAVKSLEEMGAIVRNKNQSVERGFEATTYSLNVATLVQNVDKGSAKSAQGLSKIDTKPLVQNVDIQETVNTQETVLQEITRQQQSKALDVVVATLKDYGIPGKTSQELAETYPAEYIREKIDYFVWLMENDKRRIERNPVGFLISAIKDDYKPDAAGDDQALGKAAEATGMLKQQRDYARIRSDLPTGST